MGRVLEDGIFSVRWELNMEAAMSLTAQVMVILTEAFRRAGKFSMGFVMICDSSDSFVQFKDVWILSLEFRYSGNVIDYLNLFWF